MSAWSKIVGTVAKAPAPSVSTVPSIIIPKSAEEQDGIAAQSGALAAAADAEQPEDKSMSLGGMTTKAGSRGAGSLSQMVLDAGAIISGETTKLGGPASEYYTIPEVIMEIKDTKAKQTLDSFPFRIHTRAVSADAMKAVCDFARLTGDFHQLSKTDLKVIALTYLLEKEAHGTKHLRSKPRTIRGLQHAGSKTAPVAAPEEQGFSLAEMVNVAPFCSDDFLLLPAEDFSSRARRALGFSDREKAAEADEKQTEPAEMPGWGSEKDEVLEAASSAAVGESKDPDSPATSDLKAKEAEEGEWITPDNIHTADQPQWRDANEKETDLATRRKLHSSVACVTTDYAMQNVLLQMGLRLLSVKGLSIKSIRQWIKRCHTCFVTTRDMSKEFCASCGNHTMVKVSVRVDQNGVAHYYQSNRKVFNKRGTIYSIPKPKGGRQNQDLKFREDVMRQSSRRKKAPRTTDAFRDAVEFGFDKTGRGQARDKHGYGGINPNISRKKVGKKNKGRRAF